VADPTSADVADDAAVSACLGEGASRDCGICGASAPATSCAPGAAAARAVSAGADGVTAGVAARRAAPGLTWVTEGWDACGAGWCRGGLTTGRAPLPGVGLPGALSGRGGVDAWSGG
jgi:hypothetical protein